VHEELINIGLEGRETEHDAIRMYFDPTSTFTFSAHHGTAILGVIAADWDPEDPDANVGMRGLVPEAEVLFFPLVAAIVDEITGDVHGEGRAATAWINAMLSLEPGDVIAATYNPVGGQGGGVNNIDYNVFAHDKITIATALGISVVIGAGMNNTDLLNEETPDGEDSGAIVAAAVSPGTPFKRYANGQSGSNYALTGGTYTSFDKVTCSAWGTGVTTCGFGSNLDNWLGYQTVQYSNACSYNSVASKSYTNNFGGTSAASAIVAGCVIAIQGFANQMHDTKLSPNFVRHFVGGGSYVGMTPSDPDVEGSGGDPVFSFIGSDGQRFGSQSGLVGGAATSTWDFIDGDGTGNLTGALVNPWRSCQRIVVDPIFDTPGIDEIMIINGDYNMGNSGSIAALDSMYFSLDPVYKAVGNYPMPDDYTGPGDHVTYISSAWVTDIYLSGQLRGGLSPFNILQWDAVMLDSTFTSTIVLCYMWDFARRDWIQASTSELLTEDNLVDGKHELHFRVPRASRLVNRVGEYHARFVTVTQPDGDNQIFPYFYDQIRIQSGSFPGGPIPTGG
jgi:hypothetical protein